MHTSLLSQAIVNEYLRRGYMDPQLEKSTAIYKEKDCMFENGRVLSPCVKYTRPEGGLFIWVVLPKYMDARKLFLQAVEKKVALWTEAHFTQRRHFQYLKLNFSNATLEQIDTGIKRLAEVIKTT